MNSLLWVIQFVVALTFFAAGSQKVLWRRTATAGRSRVSLTGGPTWGIGLLEILGAIGIIVPAATGIDAFLTPLAALGLACLMLGAIALELRQHEISHVALPAIFFILLLFVGWGRFVS